MQAKKSDTHAENHQEEKETFDETITELEAQVAAAKEGELRARADYQNLVRRTQEERASLIKLATKSLVADLIHPLGHLSLAAQHLKDKGLDMVIQQLWSTLEEHGLNEIKPLGEKFDLATMEAVEKEENVEEKEAVVVKVISTGYSLNGEVIQHAKVVVGKKS